MHNENWGAEEWRQPIPEQGDTVICAEPGRILDGGTSNGVDCRSHSFKVVRAQHGGIYLLVRHGGGDERRKLDYSKRLIPALEAMESDARYWLLHTFLSVMHDAERGADAKAAAEYRQAFVEGRLKKRKQPGRNAFKVWIEPPPMVRAA